jgi:hypothetical protein
MAVTVLAEFIATLEVGKTFAWSITVNQSINRKDPKPKWIVEWQALPLYVAVDTHSPNIATAKPGLQISPVTIVKDEGTGLTYIFQITCVDNGNPPGSGAQFVILYEIYAIFFDVP